MVPSTNPELEQVRQKLLMEEAQRRAEAKRARWLGNPPAKCEVCSAPIDDEFVDGRLVLGPWANMCCICHHNQGVGLGTGKGQHYRMESNGVYYKVRG
jgi:hypothetical protein